MKIEDCINALATKAAEDEDSSHAMRFSQAAQNLSNVLATFQNMRMISISALEVPDWAKTDGE